MTEKTCAERSLDHWESVKEDLARYMDDAKVYEEGSEDGLSPFWEYPLGIDYVAPKTFEGQKEGYWRYQMSWGGPSDEIRFFGDVHGTFHRAEYWFMDWGDGAKIFVTRDRRVAWLWEQLVDTDTVRSTYEQAMED